MALTFTDRNEKIVLHSWGRFRATLFVAVVTGDLLGLYSSTTSSLTLADDSSGPAAIAVAVENIAAGKTGWCALAAELKAPTSIGSGGAVTQLYFDDGSAKDIGQVLYLDEDGKCEDDIGSTTKQQVGYQIARDRILLVPGGMVTGAGAFTTISASSTVSFDSTLSVAGALTPTSSNTPALGSASKMWADLFLGEGAVINFNAGDVTITHSGNTLAFAGATTGYTFDGPVTMSSTTGQFSQTVTTLAENTRATRFIYTCATPAMNDGIGAFEIDLTISGTGTGHAAATSTWINIGSGATLAASFDTYLHTDGYWDAGSNTISGTIAWAKYQCLLQSNPAWCSLWNLNFSGGNSEIDAIFDVNDATLALGYTAGGATDGNGVGTIPFFSIASGTIYYIHVYDTAA